MNDRSVQESTLDAASAQQIVNLSLVYLASRCLHVVTELGVADRLGDEPETSEELGNKVGADPGALNRVLRVLAQHEIFEESDGRYRHTPLSRLLRADHPQSQRGYIRMVGSDLFWTLYGWLDHSVRTGQPATSKLDPPGLFPYLAENPGAASIFNESMTSKSMAYIASILRAYDFSEFSLIGDIGGGRGHLLNAILEEVPGAKGILFDLPQVIEQAQVAASDRLQLHPGNFFENELPTCDCYLMMHVIHDWADREAIAILQAVRKAAPAESRLVLLESALLEGAVSSRALLLDVGMLVFTGGQERTRNEYEMLLEAAGWRLSNVISTDTDLYILESFPA